MDITEKITSEEVVETQSVVESNFFRGLINGILLSIPLWVVILYLIFS